MDGRGRRWAWLGAGVLVVSAGLLAERTARSSLERRAREVDLIAAVRGMGLEGRVSVPQWERSNLRWLPRPALRMRGVHATVLSGRPGPGAASGRIRFESVDLVPAWGFPLRGGLDHVEVRGGVLEIGPDLLPPVPRDYVDPISGAVRAIPWSALLRVIQEGGGTASASLNPEKNRPRPFIRREPAVVAHDLEIRLPAALLPAGESVQVEEARLLAEGDDLELVGELRVRASQGAWSVPVRILRAPGGLASGYTWDVALGSDSSGIRVRASEPGSSGPPSWTGDLRDPRGTVAQALLDGRGGPLGRLRWEGPWSVQASGDGWRLSGVREATVSLLGGTLSMPGSAKSRTEVTGTVRILPGRVDIPRLALKGRTRDQADSAEVQLHWVSTTSGLHLTGRLAGRFDPGWVGMLGDGWRAAGWVDATLSFEGVRESREGRWILAPRGRLDGTIAQFRGPWFADSLKQGSLEAWSTRDRIGFVLAGIWGSSTFRLEARDLPLADPRRPDYARAETRWGFSSPSCRVEDFRLAAGRSALPDEIPFWLALPGRGELRIDDGSVAGVAFDGLSMTVDRRGNRFGLDRLEVNLGGGRITGGSGGGRGGRAGVVIGEARLEVDQVDLRQLRSLLVRLDPRLARGVEGKLSGSARLRWPSLEAFDGGLQLDGSVRISDGSLRGLPIQEELRRRTHLDRLEVLSFDLLETDIRRDAAALQWNRFRLEAPPWRAEGAGRLDAGDSLRFVLSVRTRGEDGDEWGRLLSSLIGGEHAALYAILTGSLDRPGVQVLSRAGFLRELDRLGGTLPTEATGPRR